MAATAGLIPFDPKDEDVVSCKRWNVKHPGMIAYGKLIDEHVGQLPNYQTNHYHLRLKQLALKVVKIITMERHGRFLKIGGKDDKFCTVMSVEAAVDKVRRGLHNRDRKLLGIDRSPKAKAAAASSGSTPKKEESSSDEASPNRFTDFSFHTKSKYFRASRKATTTATPPAQETACVSTTTDNSSTTGFYSYPSYVYNKRKAKRAIEEFVGGLVHTKACSCNNSWCYLWRPHYVFENPSFKTHLVDTIAGYHSQGQWSRSSSISQWFVKANKYRIVLTLQGATIHLCKTALCRILGLTEDTQKTLEGDQRILVFMKRQAPTHSEDNNKKTMEQFYQEFKASSEGNESKVTPQYFGIFWKINLPNVLAGLWVQQNSKRGMMDSLHGIHETGQRGSKRLRNKAAESAKTTTTTTTSKPTDKGTRAVKKLRAGTAKTTAILGNHASGRPAKRPRVGTAKTTNNMVRNNNNNRAASSKADTTKPAARRVSNEGVVPTTVTTKHTKPTHWRCQNCFHEQQTAPEMFHPPWQRESIASLNRKHQVRKRKARFIRRSAFHPISKLSSLG